MENNEVLETMERINSLILYFSEVQIHLIATKKIASVAGDNALAAASIETANGVNKIINIFQSNFELVEKEAGVMQIPIEDKRPQLKIVGGTDYGKKD